MEQYLPGLLLSSEFLPDPVQPLIEVNTQTGQDFFLCNVNGLGMSLSASKKQTNTKSTECRNTWKDTWPTQMKLNSVAFTVYTFTYSYPPANSGSARPRRWAMKSVSQHTWMWRSWGQQHSPSYKAAQYPFSLLQSSSPTRMLYALSTLFLQSVQNLCTRKYHAVSPVLFKPLTYHIIKATTVTCYLCLRKYVSNVSKRQALSMSTTSSLHSWDISSHTSIQLPL